MSEIPIKPSNSSFNDQQWQAIHQKATNILVSASAGSGKTTVLVERILNHLDQGLASLDQLLVVTFTDLAAKEMKERLEAALKSRLNQTSDSQEQRRYLLEINKLNQANIQTLHSFCLEVIQEYFYLIDLNPSTDLLTDESHKALIYQEVWQEVCEEIEAGQVAGLDSHDFEELLAIYSNHKSDTGLFETIVNLYHTAMSHPNPLLWINHLGDIHQDFDKFIDSDLFQSAYLGHLRSALSVALDLNLKAQEGLSSLSEDHIESYSQSLDQDKQMIESLLMAINHQDLDQMINLSRDFAPAKWKPNRKTNEDFHEINYLKSLRDQYSEIIKKEFSQRFKYSYQAYQDIELKLSRQISSLAHLLRAFLQTVQAYKRQKHLMDYNDLEHYSLEILAPFYSESGQRQASEASLAYTEKFYEILVDEYQDINEIQAEILKWLSKESMSTNQGNQFMVGDVKQSIYGFRMAEPQLFLNKYQAYQNDPNHQLIVLDRNYRSRDEVLQFINFLFERIMDQDFGQMNYGRPEALKTGNHLFQPQSPDYDFNIEFHLFEKEGDDQEDDDLTFDTSLEAECHILGQKIRSLIDQGLKIYDKKMGQMRPLQYKDIVILSATKNPFIMIQEVLHTYSIPVYSQKIESYFQRHEVQLILAILKIIDNPIQDLPLVAVLRSFFVGLTDEELSLIRIGQKEGHFYGALKHFMTSHKNIFLSDQYRSIYQKLDGFLEKLESWRLLSRKVSLVQLIWQIYQDSFYLEYIEGQTNADQRLANLHGFYQHAENFEKKSSQGLYGFIRYIEQMIETDNDLAEPLTLDSDQDFVRIMTVHASKGLEFPVLFLVNVGKDFNLQDLNKKYIASKDFGLASQYFDTESLLKYDSLVYQAFRLELENKLKAEEMRKLYVALTRCEQKLYIIASIKSADYWQEKIEQSQDLRQGDSHLVNHYLRSSSRSWLSWLNNSLAIPEFSDSVADFSHQQIQTYFYNEANLRLNQEGDKENLSKQQNLFLDQIDQVIQDQAGPRLIKQEVLDFWDKAYPYDLATRTSSYQSVSELKRYFEEPYQTKLDNYSDRRLIKDQSEAKLSIQGIRFTDDKFLEPVFVSQEKKAKTYAEIGSLNHLFLQYLDFKAFKDLDKSFYLNILNNQAKQLVDNHYLHQDDFNYIEFEKINNFLLSKLGQIIIKHSDQLKREEAFSYLLPANLLFAKAVKGRDLTGLGQDDLLVHGVIDGYLKYQDKIILFDYKTDRFLPHLKSSRQEQIEAIKNKYLFQMSIYGQALENVSDINQVELYLVLLDFSEVVKLENILDS